MVPTDVGQNTDKIINILRNAQKKIVKKNIKTGKLLYTRLKEQTEKLMESNVMYKVKCGSCEKSYIGQTSQWLKNRIAGHKTDIRSGEPKCMLGIHTKETGHEINWETITIIKSKNN